MYIQASQDNRRSAYRVRPFASDDLQLHLHDQRQRLIPDLIADVTSDGASVCFDKGNIPDLAPGDEVSVRIISSDLNGNVKLLARIAFTGDNPRGRLIGLTFTSNRELINRGNQNLLQLFNRRAAYRGVEPESPDALRAVVQTAPLAMVEDAETRTVTVRNISTTGICLRVDDVLDEALQKTESIRLLLQVSETGDPREFRARICNRTRFEGGGFYGCHFDWSKTANALDAIEELAGYTLDRLAEVQDTVKH